MKPNLPTLLALSLTVSTPIFAQISVPPGFTVEQLPSLRGRVEAIGNQEFGTGVVVARIVNVDKLEVLRVSGQVIDVLGSHILTIPGAVKAVGDIRFDWTGLFGGDLYICVVGHNSDGSSARSQILRMGPTGAIASVLGPVGSSSRNLYFKIDFGDGSGGETPGLYLLDLVGGSDLTEFWYLGPPPAYSVCTLATNTVPAGLVDVDPAGFELDRSGLYQSRFVVADSDTGHHEQSSMFRLFDAACGGAAPAWARFSTPVNIQSRNYVDMALCAQGAFGPAGGFGPVYITESVQNRIMAVDPSGVHSDFAAGFQGIGSITCSEDGSALFVNDSGGLYKIRPVGNEPGPVLVMRSPDVEPDDAHGGPSGVDSQRLLFSEPIEFSAADLEIVDEAGMPVPFSVAGSGTAFLLIQFGVPLRNDVYTITVRDSAVGATTALPIDGDGNGIAGGDLVFVMRHETCHLRRSR